MCRCFPMYWCTELWRRSTPKCMRVWLSLKKVFLFHTRVCTLLHALHVRLDKRFSKIWVLKIRLYSSTAGQELILWACSEASPLIKMMRFERARPLTALTLTLQDSVRWRIITVKERGDTASVSLWNLNRACGRVVGVIKYSLLRLGNTRSQHAARRYQNPCHWTACCL